MSITFKAASTTADGAAPSSITLTRPAEVTDGDLMLAFIVIPGDQTISGAPSGWTSLASEKTGTASGDCRHVVYWKVAAGEAGSYNWTFSAGADTAGALLAFSGAATSPVQVSAYNLMSTSTPNHAAPSVTPTTGSTRAVFAVGVNPVYDGNTTFTTPTGLTARAEADPGAGTTNRAVLKVWDAALSDTTATGAKTTTLNNSAKGVAFSVVIAPSGAVDQHIVISSRAVA